MRKTNKQLKIISGLLIFVALALNINSSFAAIIKDENGNPVSWSDNERAKDTYRPNPILFIHGFSSGGPLETWVERVNQKENLKPNLDKKLERYFKYYAGYNRDPTILLDTRFPYLELISFIDFTQSKRSQLIDRNSSVDTYQKGDYYVKSKERLIGGSGWSDKLEKTIQKLRENYKDKYGYPLKVILVCHSMGGLSAREYLTNPKYSYSLGEVEKLILIGVPNLGSPFAKLANGLTRAQRVGWFIPGAGWLFSLIIEGFDIIIEQKGQIDIDGDAIRDMDPTKRGSGFLTLLNGRIQPQNVDYFAIWGNGDSLSDILVSRQLYQGEGDGVISKDSQLGTGVLSLKDSLQIAASHGTEPLAITNDDARPLLKFIDNTEPEVTITLPDPNANPVTEVKTLSINLKGSVSKEYLPADSILKIETQRQEDGETKIVREDKLLHPSDQWVPNDSNSIRAEFDEVVTFSGNGTYKISCQVTNPAGLTSDIKEVWVKVTVPQEAGIIVHCHNPEGKEIASIQGVGQRSVEIYDGSALIGYGAYNADTHGKPISIPSGNHTIKAKFNGMVLEQKIDIIGGTTQELTFTFTRTSIDISSIIGMSGNASDIDTGSDPFPGWGRLRGRSAPRDGYWTEPNRSSYYEFYQAMGIVNAEWWNDEPSTWSLTANMSYVVTSTSISMEVSSELVSSPGGEHIYSPWIDLNGSIGCQRVSAFSGSFGFTNWFAQQIVGDYPRPDYPYYGYVTGIELLRTSQYDEGIQITPGWGSRSYWYNPNGYYMKSIGTAIPINKVRFITLFPTQRVGLSGSASFSSRIVTEGLKISSVPYDLLGTGV